MIRGTVFDIKEFSVYDGPGVRTTVFLKGCPLSCRWCHNPEGLSPRPEILVSAGSCTGCGKCTVEGCSRASDGLCSACGRCLEKCPRSLRRICGREYTVDELTETLLEQKRFFKGGGGVTFSGGEPLYQAEFLTAMLDSLRREGIHTAIQTSGYTSEKVFSEVLARCDFVLFDIKHPDNDAHMRYTGVPNVPILKNLELLKRSSVPFIGRTPLIEGVNSSQEVMTAIAELVSDAENMQRYELLPYNEAAGGKYAMAGRVYGYPEYSRPTEIYTAPFSERGIEVKIL